MLRLSKFFTILFILTSFITQSMGKTGILFRITTPDIFGALAIIFYMFSNELLPFSRYKYIMVFIGALFIGGIFGLNFTQSMVEVLILIFLFLMFMVMIAHFDTHLGLKTLIVYFALAGILASIFGIYDLVASMVGLPRVFPGRAEGEVLSGFRNAGQAGAYAMIILAVLIPAKSSKMFDLFNLKQKRILNFGIIITLIFLFLTGKIAAYIGFAIGLGLFFLMQRNRKAFLMTIIITGLFFLFYENLNSIAPEVFNRIQSKYNSRVAINFKAKTTVLNKDQFIGSNLRLAVKAFKDNPLTGSGIGGFAGIYEKYEVHSTYFKIIGETGSLGVIAYLVFLFNFLKTLKLRSRSTPNQEFLYYLLPFLTGCFISWAYTYHMRKREFWIMFAIMIIVNQLIKYDYIRDIQKKRTKNEVT
ncbi:MAG TPA: hypothetical protein DCR40_19160 [Prolixibacteraceae bacterium]|nr:hypothetical protein [Prolixibacteraceae bacterium]